MVSGAAEVYSPHKYKERTQKKELTMMLWILQLLRGKKKQLKVL